jgi:TonB-linked SusC/RagA family outer membrane protein
MRPQILFHTLLLACFVFLLPLSAHAQERTVTGTVTSSEDDGPLPGASVVVVGTSTGTSTDAQGRYEIEVPSGDVTLRFSFVGFEPKEVSVGDRTEINVSLVPDYKQLDEVVVVGYGSQIQRDVTGTISQVETQDLENISVTSFEEALQGKAAGVFVENSSGKLGQGIKVQVRGVSSVSADNQPLYVIDGVPVTTQNLSSNEAATNPLADLNYNDIESIQILKDAASAAIYGARGSNGVVLIETKSGRAGKTTFSVNYQMSSSEPTNKVDFLNAEQYVNLYLEAAANSNRIDPSFDYVAFTEANFDFFARGTDWRSAIDGNPVVDANWQDQAFQSSWGTQVNASVNGGDEQTQFYLSGGYDDQSGIMFRDEFQRINGRVNVDHTFSDWLQVGGRLSIGQTINDRIPNDNQFSTPLQLIAQMPISPIFEPQAEDVPRNDDGFLTDYVPSDDLNANTLYFNNLLYGRGNARYQTKIYRSLANTYAEVQLLPSLRVRSEFGLDLLDQNEDEHYVAALDENTGGNDGLGINTWNRVINYNTNNFVNYNGTLADVHSLDATVGVSFQNSTTDETFTVGERFPNDSFGQIDSAADIVDGGANETSFRFLAYFARLNYKYNDRYLLTLSGRTEGSSRFGENNRYGFFPAASAGWILSEEDFLADSPVSFLKLRGSVGLTGNAQISNFAPLGLFQAFRYSGASGIRPVQIPNPDLKWEQTTQYNLGVDYGFLNNRISGSVDVYLKKTNDLLLGVNVPGTTGFEQQLRNVGQMENRGIEFSITSTNVATENFNWSTNVNFGANENEITDLDGQVIEGGFVNRAIEGEPLGVFFALEYAGVDPDNGDALYFVNEMDEDGNIVDPEATTNNPNAANRVVIGSPLPDFQGGVGNEFTYRGFDFNFFWQFVYGNQIYDGGGRFKSANAIFFDNQTTDQLDRWQESGDQTDVPEARLFIDNGQAPSSRYLYDGSYLRLKTVTLGYTLPESILGRFGIDRLRIYATGSNLLTFTDYKWWDPEVNADYLSDEDGAFGNLSLGNEFYSAPQARRITGGIQFSF